MLAKLAQVISSLKNKKKMAEKIYTLSQIAEHKSKKDCWLAVNGRVIIYRPLCMMYIVYSYYILLLLFPFGYIIKASTLIVLTGTERYKVPGRTPRRRRSAVRIGRERCYKAV